jgi:hypothetical protein
LHFVPSCKLKIILVLLGFDFYRDTLTVQRFSRWYFLFPIFSILGVMLILRVYPSQRIVNYLLFSFDIAITSNYVSLSILVFSFCFLFCLRFVTLSVFAFGFCFRSLLSFAFDFLSVFAFGFDWRLLSVSNLAFIFI